MLLFCSEELIGNALQDFVKQSGGTTNAFSSIWKKLRILHIIFA